MPPVSLSLVNISEADARGFRNYTYRIEIPSNPYLYSVAARSEEEALLRIRKAILESVPAPVESRSFSDEGPRLTGGIVLGIAAATLAARWVFGKVSAWLEAPVKPASSLSSAVKDRSPGRQ